MSDLRFFHSNVSFLEKVTTFTQCLGLSILLIHNLHCEKKGNS